MDIENIDKMLIFIMTADILWRACRNEDKEQEE